MPSRPVGAPQKRLPGQGAYAIQLYSLPWIIKTRLFLRLSGMRRNNYAPPRATEVQRTRRRRIGTIRRVQR